MELRTGAGYGVHSIEQQHPSGFWSNSFQTFSSIAYSLQRQYGGTGGRVKIKKRIDGLVAKLPRNTVSHICRLKKYWLKKIATQIFAGPFKRTGFAGLFEIAPSSKNCLCIFWSQERLARKKVPLEAHSSKKNQFKGIYLARFERPRKNRTDSG